MHQMLQRDDDRVKIGMEPRLFEWLIFSQTKTTRSELDMKYDLTSILRGWAKILNEEKKSKKFAYSRQYIFLKTSNGRKHKNKNTWHDIKRDGYKLRKHKNE